MNNPVIEIRLCYISYSCIILLHRLCIAPKYHVTLKVLVDRVDIIRLCKVNVFSCDWGTKQLLDRQQGWFLSHNVCISLDPFSFPLTNAAMFPHVSKSNPKLTNWPTQRQQQQNPLMPITTSNSVVYVPHCLQIHAWCTLLSPLASNGNLVHQYSSSNQFFLMLPSIVQYFMATNPPFYPAKVDCKPHTYVVSYTHYTILHHLNWNQENDPDMMYILFVQYVK